MFFGADGPLAINFDNFELVRDVCTFALVFIMFYGGFSTNWRQARPVAVKAFLLSSLGVVLTAALVGLFCHFVLGLELVASLLLGSVISSTDAVSVFFVLRSRRLHLRDNTASLLEVESGSNDPCAYMLTFSDFTAAITSFSTPKMSCFLWFAPLRIVTFCVCIVLSPFGPGRAASSSL